jgi:hypothetical protein
MNTRAKIIAAAAALAAATGVFAQSSVDKAFTAAPGQNCTQITWSAEMLAKHPKIASACQEVLEKDGKTYVKFEGEIKKVAKKGTEVTMEMKGTDNLLYLTPKPGRTVYINGKKTPVSQLRPGDTLTFYIPSDRVVAAVMETPAAPVEEIAIAPEPPPMPMAAATTEMPKTASSWPLVALFGALAIGFAGVMRTRRVLRNR